MKISRKPQIFPQLAQQESCSKVMVIKVLLYSICFFLSEHKIGSYYTKSGYETELKKLKILIQSDMKSINEFIKRCNELHKPNTVNLENNAH